MTVARIEPAVTEHSPHRYPSTRTRTTIAGRVPSPRTTRSTVRRTRLLRLPQLAGSRWSAPFTTQPHRAAMVLPWLGLSTHRVTPGSAESVPLVAVLVPTLAWPTTTTTIGVLAAAATTGVVLARRWILSRALSRVTFAAQSIGTDRDGPRLWEPFTMSSGPTAQHAPIRGATELLDETRSALVRLGLPAGRIHVHRPELLG